MKVDITFISEKYANFICVSENSYFFMHYQKSFPKPVNMDILCKTAAVVWHLNTS